ncbi:regulatory protein RecX [Ligilactobacillus salitolerans]|uniref:Regulatory protein RecX n=1 Tax=Ligilactobacillus salitolerans TaxID=1808352 RepID=A0A401IV62_9LACO|nr:recombination regulator RecX [Ligilactobacillus salitolerans]GBG95433.1 regulatory protein RecX [Ligilactobacillus salitolerans]
MTQKITMIKTQKRKGRYNIYLDGKYAFPIGEDVLIRFALSKGQELTEEEIQNITEADNTSKAYQKALNYLSHQLRTKKEVRDHLAQQEIAVPDIEKTIDKLVELKLLDDLQYAKSFVRTMARTSDKGPTVISAKLKQKGILADDISDALLEFPLADQIKSGLAAAKKSANHLHGQSFRAATNKIFQQLMQKGFSSEVVSEVMDELDLKSDDEAESSALREQGDKLWRKNQRFDPKKQVQKVREGLYRKGFASDLINNYLEDKQAEQEKE